MSHPQRVSSRGIVKYLLLGRLREFLYSLSVRYIKAVSLSQLPHFKIRDFRLKVENTSDGLIFDVQGYVEVDAPKKCSFLIREYMSAILSVDELKKEIEKRVLNEYQTIERRRAILAFAKENGSLEWEFTVDK